MTPDAETIDAIEKLGYALYRDREYRLGTKVLALVLHWRGPSSLGFTCDVDESAGLAEVIELRGWSKKVPCA